MKKSLALFVCVVLIYGLFCGCKQPDFKRQKYDNAVAYVDNGDFEEALNIFESDYSLRSYNDGANYYNYAKAMTLYNKGIVSKAYESFLKCGGFKDTSDYLLMLERFFEEIEGRYNNNVYGQT